MPSSYESIINNLNICKTLMLEETVCAFQTKEIKLNDLESIKEESANFTTQREFRKSQEKKEDKKNLEHI